MAGSAKMARRRALPYPLQYALFYQAPDGSVKRQRATSYAGISASGVYAFPCLEAGGLFGDAVSSALMKGARCAFPTLTADR